MRVFGRRLSNWWLLLFIPLIVVASPLLLIAFFAANRLAGAIVGPPAIWNRTFHPPSREELVGSYVESERHWDRSEMSGHATLELDEDGSMNVNNLPYDDITSTCLLSGSGKWSGPIDGNDNVIINLILTAKDAQGSCAPNSYSFLELAGHAKPYGLYWVLGDPDSGTGIWLKKQ
jgi:hypothetical protein